MKKSLKLIPAIVMLLVSAILVSTTTFAWFSMNTTVTVTGMSVTTKVGSNLLISPDTTESNFTTIDNRSRTGILEPVSTVDGEHFFYTLDAKADGSKATLPSSVPYVAYNESATYVAAANDADTALAAAAKTNLDTAFNTAYGIDAPTDVAFGYIDYNFYLKATSTQDDQKLSMNLCRLLYNNSVANDNAWRVAVFKTAGQSTASAASGAALSLLTILTPFGAENQTDGKAVDTTTTVDDVTYGTAATLDGDIDAGDTRYYKVLVRLYLEGEDKTCTNATYAVLTSAFTLDLEFKLSGDAGVTLIATSKAAATASSNTATVAMNNGETATGYQWKNASDDSNIAGATNATYTNNTASAVDAYCVVTTAGGSYTSNTVHVAAQP